jgi:hypothetical protein
MDAPLHGSVEPIGSEKFANMPARNFLHVQGSEFRDEDFVDDPLILLPASLVQLGIPIKILPGNLGNN